MASYDIISKEDGFDVVPVKYDYIPVIHSRLDEYGTWSIFEHGCEAVKREIYGTYAFRDVLDTIVHGIYIHWKSPKTGYVPNNLRKWVMGRTGKTLNHRVRDEWKRCLNNLNPDTNEIHKGLFAINGGKGEYRTIPEILKSKNSYAVSDLKNYRATKIAALLGGWDGTFDWIDVFSDYGNYRSLNRTLSNLPYGVTNYKLPSLKHRRMSQPITTRMKLMFYLGVAEESRFNYRFPEGDIEKMFHIVEKSTEEECRNAVRYLWRYFPTEKSNDFRCTQDISRVIGLLTDVAPSNDKINLINWTKECELYHHNLELQRRIQAEQRQRRYEEMQKINTLKAIEMERIRVSDTAVPPIPLPENPNIKFLKNYKEVVNEGKEMEHCVASYAEKAVLGDCYLFHVDHNGVPATVEVSPTGFVKQSYSKRDKVNEASEYAKSELNRWGKNIGDKKPKLIYKPLPENEEAIKNKSVGLSIYDIL